MNSTTKLTAARLKELLHYDPQTGVFAWRVAVNRRIRIGSPAGHAGAAGYVWIGIAGRLYLAHRLAWLYMTGAWPSEEIDHRVGKSNRWSNLRAATSRLNKENLRAAPLSNKSTHLLGAYPYGDRFKSQIKVDGRQIHLGVFDSPQQAHEAYVAAKRRLHAGCTI